MSFCLNVDVAAFHSDQLHRTHQKKKKKKRCLSLRALAVGGISCNNKKFSKRRSLCQSILPPFVTSTTRPFSTLSSTDSLLILLSQRRPLTPLPSQRTPSFRLTLRPLLEGLPRSTPRRDTFALPLCRHVPRHRQRRRSRPRRRLMPVHPILRRWRRGKDVSLLDRGPDVR